MTKKALHILAEYAPGIPSKVVKDLPRISSPQIMQLAIQRHEAKRAGEHYDVRIVDDKSGKAYSWAVRNLPSNPGDKTLAVLQPTHTASYSTWSGTIESGYGAGTVNLFSNDRIEVLKAEPTKITFNVYKSNGDTDRYAMINTGGDNWLFHNVTPTRVTRSVLPTEKPKYKSESLTRLDPSKSDEVWAPKIDGALNVFLLRPDKPIETYSYRPSAKGAHKLIDHTYRLGLHNRIVPTAFKGNTVVLGEVFARDRSTGKVLSSTDTTSRLLSNVWKSRELQENAPLDNVVFNVLRYNGRDVSKKPYSEKLKILQTITTAIPELKLPPLHSTSDSKAALLKDIKEGRHPLTEEGVVVYNTNADTPVKAKVQQDYDVYVRGVFPGEKKYKGKAAGGFTYSFKPTGPITGRVGSGLTDTMRKELWEKPDTYVGSVARIFAQQQLPSGALRMPVFKDMRPELWKNSSYTPSRLYAQYMSRDDNGKRKYTWIAHNKKPMFEAAYKHVTENGYIPESPMLTMLKKAALDLGHIGKEFILPSLVAGPIIGAGVTAATAKNKKEFKEHVGKGIKTGIIADAATGAALGLWGQRKTIMQSLGKVASIPAAEPITGYPISTTNLHEIGKTQGEEMPDSNVTQVRKYLRKKAAIFMTETAGANQIYTDTSAERIMESDATNPASISAAKKPKQAKKQVY